MPFRVEIGPRDVAAGQGVLVPRTDRGKEPIPLDALATELPTRLAAYQAAVFQRALDFRAENTHDVDEYARFREIAEGPGGFLMAHWCGDAACERKVSDERGATIRVIPFDAPRSRCLHRRRSPFEQRVLFARAYWIQRRRGQASAAFAAGARRPLAALPRVHERILALDIHPAASKRGDPRFRMSGTGWERERGEVRREAAISSAPFCS